jgi:uncharacterized membrane protein (UPF0127 family)
MATMPRRSHGARLLPPVLFAVIVLCLVWTPGALAQSGRVPPWRATLPAPPAEARITVGQTPLTVQLAVTPAQQTLGLGYRNGLAQGAGMLFVFDVPQIQTFWMKGMRFCLDIVWVSSTQVVGAAESVCPDPPGIADADRPVQTSPAPVQYVLELPAGWLKQHGYGAGTPVDLSALPATPAAFAAPPL